MSGTSTPRGNRSPPPDGGGPSPLTIGKRFVKQYYQTLMTTPDQIHRFYQPTSVLSDGEGSSPTDPVSFASMYDGSAEKLKDRFFVKDLQIRFEFEHGAIDAQQSVNGGLLLVVTGHVVYYPSASEDEDAAVDDPIRKGFVHTFFLNVNAVGTKKSFYVHNDILRFLKNTSEVSAVSESAAVVTETQSPPLLAAPKETTPPAEPVPETKAPAPETLQPPVALEPPKKEKSIAPAPEEEVAPGGGVEETKEEPPTPAPPAPAPAPASKPPKEDKPNKKDGAKGGKSSARSSKAKDTDAGRKSPVPSPSPAPKPAPGSWASLVAGAGGSTAATTASTKPPPAASTKPPPKPTPASEKPPTPPTNDKKESSGAGNPNVGNNANNSNNNNNTSNTSHKMGNTNNMRPPKRDPDCTLVIKNLAESTKEQDVLGVFEPFAEATKARVVGITVAAHRGIAFVDFDSVNPVNMACKQHKEHPIQLFGRVLEVDQKTAEQRARRAANRGGGGGGNYRSGSPSHNGGVNRYDSRGRGGHRRRDGGRGDRGDRGGGMGGRGGRGGR